MRQLLLILVALILAGSAHAVVFNDGTVHVIDASNSFPADFVFVEDAMDGSPTTLVLAPGGVVGSAQVPTGITVRGASTVSISGGSVAGDGDIRLEGSATAIMTSGTVGRGLTTVGLTAHADVSGGVVDELNAANGSIDISGGRVADSATANGGLLTVSGGDIWFLSSSGSGRAVIAGGIVRRTITSVGTGQIDISGGTLLDDLRAIDSSTVTISGGGFNLPPGDVVPLQGTLTGSLSDGSPLGVDFIRASTARITLVATQTTDSDGDGIDDGFDNCPDDFNPGQIDTDGDGVGDACNDLQDLDGDEWADGLDNCPADANPLQQDADSDLIGDACDPFPNDPDNEQAQCEADLLVCQSTAGFLDMDMDGEHDMTDACPMTPLGQAVDQAGCSQDQFCSPLPVTTARERGNCRKADWGNDEPRMRRDDRDCFVDRRGRGPDDDVCASTGAP